jgi:hypothetical protein
MKGKLNGLCNSCRLKEKNGILIMKCTLLYFYCVNDNSKVSLYILQMMHCLLCHFQLVFSTNSRKQLRKGLITYYKHVA